MEEAFAVNRDKKIVEIIIHTTANNRANGPFGVLSPYLEIVKMTRPGQRGREFKQFAVTNCHRGHLTAISSDSRPSNAKCKFTLIFVFERGR